MLVQTMNKGIEYPCLITDAKSGLVIMASQNKKWGLSGFVVEPGSTSFSIGEFCPTWVEEKFVEFKGTVILSNN